MNEKAEEPTLEENEIPVEKIVKFIKMKNGDDIVCQLMSFRDDEEDEFYHMFICPLKIEYRIKEETKLSFVLKEWIFSEFCSEQEFAVYPNEILTVGSASSTLITYYFDSLERLGMNNCLKDKVSKQVPIENNTLKTIAQGVPIHSNSTFDLASVNVHRKVKN